MIDRGTMDYIICTGLFILAAAISPLVKKWQMSAAKSKICDVLYSLFVSLVIANAFDVCPYSGRMLDGDSSVFIYMATMMHKGYVPYRDYFDHKGPWLYFIEFFGLSGGTVFLWILEIITLAVTAFIIIRIADEMTDSKFVSYLSVFAVLYVSGYFLYRGGNYTEFWSLPFICLSLLIFIRFFKYDRYSIPSVIMIGFSFGVVFLMRCNLISVWACFLPAVLIKLIAGKRWSDILKCAGSFILGVIICVIPVLIYYGVNDALGVMYDCYWEYNLYYTVSKSGLDNQVLSFVELAKYLWPGWIALIPSLIRERKSVLHLLNLLYLVLTSVLAVISGRAFENYFINCLPCLIIPVATTLGMISSIQSTDSKKRRIGGAFILIPLVLGALVCSFVKNVTFDKDRLDRRLRSTEYLKSNTSPDSDVYVMGGNGMYNLYSGRYTRQRFFYQFPLTYNDDLYAEFWQDMEQDPPDHILVPDRWRDFDTMSEAERIVGIAAIRYDTDRFCNSHGYTRELHDTFYIYSKK